MDANDQGLCALFPAHRQYFQVKFTVEELEVIQSCNDADDNTFCINVRELMSAVFASLLWGHLWKLAPHEGDSHVRFWIDNISAVAWSNCKSSRNGFAQMLLRILGRSDLQHGFYSTASHVPGADPERLSKFLASLGTLLRAGELSQSSSKHYSRVWGQWVAWCSMMRFSPWLTATDTDKNAEQLGAFAVYLWKYGMNRQQKGNTFSTICAKLCAVRWFHRNTAGYDPGVNASHAILLRGIRRITDPVVKQRPQSARLLRVIFVDINLTQPCDQLLWGGLLLGYFFLLRRSGYLFIGKRVHSYVLRLSGIQCFDTNEDPVPPKRAKVVGITLHGAKNNPFGREKIRYHYKSKDRLLCPVRADRWVYKAARTFATRPGDPALSMWNSGITSDAIRGRTDLLSR
ncbi:hypothetical protein L914_02260 [Phytophthora nicotianae]|uniref:Uncharacterized protein n=2 Tax=Phytophthora nicotianae TaxID=4792 RepID=V9ET88_PHYNI|nr:hypothetical protein F443_12748 [Phytophthora nicotianae P1569]ETM54395.1 hypothetical protein L914_02260 [Phytophthora nicotianae]